MSSTEQLAAGSLEEIGRRDHEVTSEYRIFGPPGTGKTTNLTRQIRRAVERYGADSVLVTSFSRTAAAELAGRDLPIGNDRVGTLHSHCWHALGGPEIAEANVDEWNRDNPSLPITPARKQHKLDGEESVDEDSEAEKDGDKELQRLSRFRGLMLPPELWPKTVAEFAQRWTEYKRENGLLDFTDLIEISFRDVALAVRSVLDDDAGRAYVTNQPGIFTDLDFLHRRHVALNRPQDHNLACLHAGMDGGVWANRELVIDHL